MIPGLSEFWSQITSSEEGSSGVEVAVGSAQSDKLLGVRDGFVRYFGQGMGRPLPVAVHSEPDVEDGTHIPLTDEECLTLAHDRVLELRSRASARYQFWVCSEMGIHSLELDGDSLCTSFGGGPSSMVRPVERWGAVGRSSYPPA